MDSDKLIVMDAGTMVEFDHPYNLLQNKEGLFYKMVEQTEPLTTDYLLRVAEEVPYLLILLLITEYNIK